MKSRITFYGGAGAVTGANFLLDTGGKKFLVDCGLMQGKSFCNTCNYYDFDYDPKSIDILFVTHAHTDHIGRIPFLVRNGFSGEIYSTFATKDIAKVMFTDALKIMKEESVRYKRDPLYEEKDVNVALGLWKTQEYKEVLDVGSGVSVRFLNAGHILGSAMVEFVRGGKKLVFTGDLGNSPAPIVRDTEELSGVSYLVMESVYGDRNHEDYKDKKQILKNEIEYTRKQNGVLLIPAFSLQRTQAILHDLNDLIDGGETEPIDVYLDAPLAIKVMSIYRKYKELFNNHIQTKIDEGDDPFDFDKLHITHTGRESRDIWSAPNPKIIIAGSGMSHGGRIRSHEKKFLGDIKTTILFVGHQVVGSLGRRIQEGARSVKIDKEYIRVRARISSISGYSAHKDCDQLIEFVEQMADSLQKVFVVMGEPKSSLFLTQRLRDFLEVDATAPDKGASYEIDW